MTIASTQAPGPTGQRGSACRGDVGPGQELIDFRGRVAGRDGFEGSLEVSVGKRDVVGHRRGGEDRRLHAPPRDRGAADRGPVAAPRRCRHRPRRRRYRHRAPMDRHGAGRRRLRQGHSRHRPHRRQVPRPRPRGGVRRVRHRGGCRGVRRQAGITGRRPGVSVVVDHGMRAAISNIRCRFDRTRDNRSRYRDIATGKWRSMPRAVGELGCVGVPAAFINAVADAAGTQEIEMPATPEQVWRALRRT